jgi:hypothetical protein
LTPETTVKLLDGLRAGKPPKAGPQSGRHSSEPASGRTALTSKVSSNSGRWLQDPPLIQSLFLPTIPLALWTWRSQCGRVCLIACSNPKPTLPPFVSLHVMAARLNDDESRSKIEIARLDGAHAGGISPKASRTGSMESTTCALTSQRRGLGVSRAAGGLTSA